MLNGVGGEGGVRGQRCQSFVLFIKKLWMICKHLLIQVPCGPWESFLWLHPLQGILLIYSSPESRMQTAEGR